MTEAGQNLQTRSLYEQDILLWVEDTVTRLRSRDFEHLDIDNLIEEVESLGRSERRELVKRLVVILEHLLKRLYVDSSYDYNGWERTIRTQRLDLKFLLEDIPSLKHQWDESFAKAWSRALKKVCQDYPKTLFPEVWPFEATLDVMLDRDFWQETP